MKKIVQVGHKTLRAKAKPVALKDISGTRIQKVLADMKEALAREDDGVAIAAPQIAVSLRIFVVSGKVFPKNTDVDRVFINPTIVNMSQEREWLEEGCLSVRWKYGEISRAEKATVSAYDEHGTQFTLGASGLLAQIFQHEIDHLDGTLFIDNARNVRDIPPPDDND